MRMKMGSEDTAYGSKQASHEFTVMIFLNPCLAIPVWAMTLETLHKIVDMAIVVLRGRAAHTFAHRVCGL